MPSPIAFDYYRRSEPIRLPVNRGESLDYFRRSEPLRPIAGSAVDTAAALIGSGVIDGVTLSLGVTDTATALVSAGVIDGVTLSLGVTDTATVYGFAGVIVSPLINPLVVYVDPRAATLVSAPSSPFAVDPRAATLLS